MARSLSAGSILVLVGAATLAACAPSESRPASSTGGDSVSSSSAAGGLGGQGGTAVSSSGAGGNGSSATVGTGGSGAGGAGGAGIGGAGAGGEGGAGGVIDPLYLDQDGDGWTPADGDCCDTLGSCSKPELVNPGAFEYLGNLVDDDCDVSTQDDVVPAPCSTMPLDLPTSSLKLAQAMDICNVTTENAPLPNKKWGIISTALTLADGSPNVPQANLQVGVLSNFGTNVTPKKGSTMAALSSGTARDEDDAGHVYPQNGMPGQIGNYNAQTVVSAPAAYLAAHGGSLQSSCGPACVGADCAKAFDSIDLKLRIRVPTNAKSFSYNLKFYTAEYPEYTCQSFNDFFMTLLKTGFPTCPAMNPGDPCMPADTNIARDAAGNPLSVNNAFLEECFPAPGAPPGACPSGTTELVGTGYGGWSGSVNNGGATEWLTNDAPVVPGETIDIEFVVFDAGDHNVDSLVLLDKFRWNITAAVPVTHK